MECAFPKRIPGEDARASCPLETLIRLLNMKLSKSAAKAVPKPSVKTRSKETVSTATDATPASGELTTIDVKLDVGYGNTLFLRGEGSGLNWERGVPLSCVDGKTWRWSAPVTSRIKCKVLLNDQVWSTGQDLSVDPGQKIEVAPAF
jgi:hypothetical protein